MTLGVPIALPDCGPDKEAHRDTGSPDASNLQQNLAPDEVSTEVRAKVDMFVPPKATGTDIGC